MRRQDVFTPKERRVIDTLLIYRVDSEKEAVNPSFLQRKNITSITREGARYTCDNLVKNGMIRAIKKRPLTKTARTDHYYLSPDLETFQRLAKMYFATLMSENRTSWPGMAGTFLGSEYTKDCLTSAFVRRILSRKGVEVLLYVNLDDPDFLRWDSAHYSVGDSRLTMRLPVSPDGSIPTGVSTRAWGDGPADEDRTRDTVASYYKDFEEEKVVRPILTLLKISSTALDYFLGDWEPYKPETENFGNTSQGYAQIEHVLFRLIWAAVWDISITREVPDRLEVYQAAVRPEHSYTLNHPPPLLLVSLPESYELGYDAGYDTTHEYYGGEDGDAYEIESNPENCWVKIWGEKTDVKKYWKDLAKQRKPAGPS